MRLVFVHGINQQGLSSDQLRTVWTNDLASTLAPNALGDISIDQPFYGDTLHRLVQNHSRAIAQSGSPAEDLDRAVFLAAALAEQAAEAGITNAEINQESQNAAVAHLVAVEQGFPMDRRINAIARLLERLSPFRGTLVMRLLDQAYDYLKKPGVAPEVDAIVRPFLTAGPIVLVTHSLGTVVTFKLLRELAAKGSPATVPLYVTLGSPLSLAAVQSALGAPFSTPVGVGRWLNAYDPDDFISLGRDLLPPRFAATVENHGRVENRGETPHSIPGYLADSKVASAIAGALSLS